MRPRLTPIPAPGASAGDAGPSCALDSGGLARQLERYRQTGAGAQLIERSPWRLVVELDERVESERVEQMVAVERECCPFFELDWQPRERRLSIGVSRAAEQPALEAIALALGL